MKVMPGDDRYDSSIAVYEIMVEVDGIVTPLRMNQRDWETYILRRWVCNHYPELCACSGCSEFIEYRNTIMLP